MSILKILTDDHPILQTKAIPVNDPNHIEIKRLISDMIETMHHAGGVGLAAPQVGVLKRVIVYHVPMQRSDDGCEIGIRALINPILTPVGAEQKTTIEGCLSLPERTGQVPRWAEVAVEAQDEQNHKVEFIAKGFHARVLQHEVDHLDGILYTQRIEA